MTSQAQPVTNNQRTFLAAFEYALSVVDACKAADVTERTVQRWRKESPDFLEAFEKTNANRGDFLEERMFNILSWATEPDPVTGGYERILGKPTLLTFALKGAKRAKYGDTGGGSSEDVKKLIELVTGIRDDIPATDGQIEESDASTPAFITQLERDLENLPD